MLRARANVGGDNDERMGVCSVPDAFWEGYAGCWKGEFDSLCEGSNKREEGEKVKYCYSCHDCVHRITPFVSGADWKLAKVEIKYNVVTNRIRQSIRLPKIPLHRCISVDQQ